MPLTQLACVVSQVQAERETAHSVFSYAAAVSKCSTCFSWLPNLGIRYTKAFYTPRVILELVVETDALILAFKTRQWRNKLFGKSWYDTGPAAVSIQDGTVLSIHVCTVHGDAQNPTGTCTTYTESVPRCPSILHPSHTHTPWEHTQYSS